MFSSTFLVRSGLIGVQLSPRSSDFSSICAAWYSTDLLCFDICTGAFQLNLYFMSFGFLPRFRSLYAMMSLPSLSLTLYSVIMPWIQVAYTSSGLSGSKAQNALSHPPHGIEIIRANTPAGGCRSDAHGRIVLLSAIYAIWELVVDAYAIKLGPLADSSGCSRSGPGRS